MARKLAVMLAVTISLLFANTASAITIPPTDLDDVNLDDLLLGPDTTNFSNGLGTLTNKVYSDEDIAGLFWYVHQVNPANNSNQHFNTGFAVNGFNGIAGWRFLEANGSGSSEEAGGQGDATDFDIDLIDGGLRWSVGDGFDSDGWNMNEPIRFFYGSFSPPSVNNYNLTAFGVGTAASYAPTPEPGSMMLLGSGLAALYGAARRRKNQKGASAPEIG